MTKDTLNPFIPPTPQIRPPHHEEMLVFLDFDGVMHPTPNEAIPQSWEQVEYYIGQRYFLSEALESLQLLCSELNASIIVTSSWRNKGFDIHDFNKILGGLVIGQTPELIHQVDQRGSRGFEIKAYLEKHCQNPRFLILDDKEMNFEPGFPHLYLTDPAIGLTAKLTGHLIDQYTINITTNDNNQLCRVLQNIIRISGNDFSIATNKMQKAILDYGSETPDNIACADQLEVAAYQELDRTYHGIRLSHLGVGLSTLINAAEGCPIPDQLKNQFPTISQAEWDAVLRLCTLLVTALELEQ